MSCYNWGMQPRGVEILMKNINERFLDNFPNPLFWQSYDAGWKLKPKFINNKTINESIVKDGYGTFFTVNTCEGTRTNNNVVALNALYGDFDMPKDRVYTKEEIQETMESTINNINAILEPTYILRTKNGIHVYWVLDEQLRKDEMSEEVWVRIAHKDKGQYITVLRRAGAVFGFDSGAHDLSRILRVPGYPHQKDINEPFVVEVVHENEAKRYSLDKLEEAFPSQQTIETVVPSSLTDEEVIAKLCKNKEHNALYNGDTSKYKGDESAADGALLCHLNFWTGRNKEQMERIWIESPLGNREKTLTRKDYRDRTITGAIEFCKYSDVYKKVDTFIPFLVVSKDTKNGRVETVIPCKENVLIALRHTESIVGKFRYNSWMSRTETILFSNEWRSVRDNDYLEVQSILSNTYKNILAIVVSPLANVVNAVNQYCEENSVDPVKDYIEGLVWDKVPRIDTWIKRTCNTSGNEEEYKIFGSQWLKALIKRIIEPGCKWDYVLVFEGVQGTRKSTAFNVLGMGYHVEIVETPNTKDFFLIMSGKSIIEFSEGETQERASMKLLKSVITNQVDVYRNPYERNSSDHPRRCVFAMTTNNQKYLKDETGNRRWLPVACRGNLDIQWLEENREQLFAEAYHKVITLKENIFEGLETDPIKEMQGDRRIERAEEDYIIEWYEKRSYLEKKEGVTLLDVFEGSLKQTDTSKMNQLQKQVMEGILENVLFLKERRVESNSLGKRKRAYYPTVKTWKVVGKGEDDLFDLLNNIQVEI